VKRLKRLHHRLLHQVVGLVSIPFEPQRQTEQPVDVRQGFRVESGPGVFVGGWRWRLSHQSPVLTVSIGIMSRIGRSIPGRGFSRSVMLVTCRE